MSSLNAPVKVSQEVIAGITAATNRDRPQVEFVFPEGKGKGSADCELKEVPIEIKVGG